MANKDYYGALGVDKNASPDDIKSAYRQKAKQYHPDKFATASASEKAEAEAKFKEVQHAYDVLSDPQKKAAYDQYGSEDGPTMGSGFGGGGGFGGFGFDAEDIISNIFSQFTGGGGRSTRYERDGDDVETTINLSFKEAYFGVARDITFNRIEKCPTCGGTGAKNANSIKTCSKCNGRGVINVEQRTPFGVMRTQRACPDCGGTGKIITDKCSDCRGKGSVRKSRTIKVNIPAGIDDGQMISMRGEGCAAPDKNGNAGNLIIVFRVAKHPLFVRDGINLYFDLPITFIQAAVGATVQVPTMNGSVSVDIPDGTQNGTTIRVKGKGMKDLRREAYGDLFIKIIVEIPKNLNPRQRAKLQEMEEIADKGRYEKIEKYNRLIKDI